MRPTARESQAARTQQAITRSATAPQLRLHRTCISLSGQRLPLSRYLPLSPLTYPLIPLHRPPLSLLCHRQPTTMPVSGLRLALAELSVEQLRAMSWRYAVTAKRTEHKDTLCIDPQQYKKADLRTFLSTTAAALVDVKVPTKAG